MKARTKSQLDIAEEVLKYIESLCDGVSGPPYGFSNNSEEKKVIFLITEACMGYRYKAMVTESGDDTYLR